MEKNDRFHTEDYHIVGDRAEIERIARSQGFINIGMADIISTLSADATNYITKGEAEGEGCVVRAMKEAVGKLPAGTEGTSRMLFDIRRETSIKTAPRHQASQPTSTSSARISTSAGERLSTSRSVSGKRESH